MIIALSIGGMAGAFAAQAQDRRRPSDPIPRVPVPRLSVQQETQRATDDAMNDPTLKRGDVISTGRGLVQFEGTPHAERFAQDFVPVRP